MNTELNVSEEAAAEMLGVRLSEVKRLRKTMLVEDAGYVSEGRSIRITPAGLKKIMGAVATGPVAVDIPNQPALCDLVVDATCPNPRILLCHISAGEKRTAVRCRVRDSNNFTRGMEIKGCRLVQETLYAYEGRLPRIKGRWL